MDVERPFDVFACVQAKVLLFKVSAGFLVRERADPVLPLASQFRLRHRRVNQASSTSFNDVDVVG
jgi:hypothetical protein